MKNIHLFLRDGKWFGNEFPEKPDDFCLTFHYMDVERAKAEALEVDKSEVQLSDRLREAHIVRTGTRYYHYENSVPTEVKPGVLYPWDGGWEKIKTCKWDGNRDACGNETCEDLQECQKSPEKWVLRLFPKSDKYEWMYKGHDAPEGSKTILYKSGKFYGYEKPEEPKQQFTESETWDISSAEALEIEDPKLIAYVTDFKIDKKGDVWWNRLTPGQPVVIKDNDTFPLPNTLEWEIVYQWLVADLRGWMDCTENEYNALIPEIRRQVLRLKEKAVVIGTKAYDFLSEDAVNAAKGIEGIVAIGGIPLREYEEDSPLWNAFVDNEKAVAIGGIEERGEPRTQNEANFIIACEQAYIDRMINTLRQKWNLDYKHARDVGRDMFYTYVLPIYELGGQYGLKAARSGNAQSALKTLLEEKDEQMALQHEIHKNAEKAAHNSAIDAAIKLFNTRGSFGTPFIEELEKLKQ